MVACDISYDNDFGPVVNGCRSSFDFTLLFEQSILTISPAVILLLYAPYQLARSSRAPKKLIPSSGFRSGLLKYVSAALLLSVQIALLVLWTYNPLTNAAVPAAVLSFISAVAVLLLSAVEHSRAVRPPTSLVLYLLVSLIVDSIQTRTLYLRHEITPLAALSAVLVGLKVLLLVLEAKSKRRFLRRPYRSYPPEATSSIINRSFFWWLSPIFAIGFKRVLTLDDLFGVDDKLSSELLRIQMRSSWKKYSSAGYFSLIYAVMHCFRWQLLAMALPRICLIGFNYAQPFLISSVIIHVSNGNSDPSDKSSGYGLIAATGLIYLGITLSTTHYQHRLYRMITCFRGAMVSLIYDRTISLDSDRNDDLAALTLMSTDLDRLTTTLQSINEIWARTIEIAIGIWLLERKLGWICVAPIFIVITCVLASIHVSKLIGPRQKVWINAIQRRVGLTSSMLSSMKSVKMLGYSSILSNLLQTKRDEELEISKNFRLMSMWRTIISFIPANAGPFTVYVISAIISKTRGTAPLTTAEIFSSLSIITLVTSPASELLLSVPIIGMSTGCFERIQTFLLSEPHKDNRSSMPVSDRQGTESDGSGVELRKLDRQEQNENFVVFEKVAVRRHDQTSDLVLRDISIQMKRGSLNMVVGVVGCGKSTLLKAALGEVECASGNIFVGSERVAYCSQTPWLPNATIREIVCGHDQIEDDDQAWYNNVVRACVIAEDILQFPERDNTLIGSRGVTLSGGQKQRLALARAIFSRCDIVFLDDVFSALDAKTEAQIVENLLSKDGLLRRLGATILLATHSVHHLPLADSIIVLGSNGQVLEQGSYPYLRSEGSFVSQVLVHPEMLHQRSSAGIKDTAEPVNGKSNVTAAVPKAFQGPSANDVSDLTRRTGDIAVYGYYLSSIGWKICLASVVSSFLFMVGSNFPTLWLNWYGTGTIRSIGLFASIYALSVMLSISMIALTLAILYMWVTPKSGAALHKNLLQAVMHAPQAFFDKTDSGVILNRFSQDMMLIDGHLPSSAVIILSTTFQCLAKIGLIATGSTYMALTCPVLIGCLWLVQKAYLLTSRQLRFIDLEQRSPLYTNFAETIEGISTIRAFGWQEAFSERNMQRLDASQRPYYLLFCIQRWLILVLQLLVGGMGVVLVGLAVGLKNTASNTGLIGVSLSSIVGFNAQLAYLMMFWTQMETSIGAVARIKGFEAETENENKLHEAIVPIEEWPSNGKVEFCDISADYGPGIQALQSVSFKIKSGEKVGICGRTGSGKSTLISVLLRLLDMSSGTLLIDNVDISTLPRDLIRSRFITIPQDAFLLSGTLRFNLDPTHSLSDATIITALEIVGLWVLLESRGGLDTDIKTQPLSQGQNQILFLARAMLRTLNRASGILILDEPTSNVDIATDQLIQRVIREEFRGYTAIIVSHRLDTISRCDKICVMDQGRVVGFDSPEVLLELEDFRNLMGVHE